MTILIIFSVGFELFRTKINTCSDNNCKICIHFFFFSGSYHFYTDWNDRITIINCENDNSVFMPSMFIVLTNINMLRFGSIIDIFLISKHIFGSRTRIRYRVTCRPDPPIFWVKNIILFNLISTGNLTNAYFLSIGYH